MPRKGNFRLLRVETVSLDGKDVKVLVPIKADRELDSTQDAEKYIMSKEGTVSGVIAIVDMKKMVKVEVKTAVVIEDVEPAPAPAKKEKKPEPEPEPPAEG